MKKVVESERRTAELTRWRGADATIWMFHVSLKRLAVKVSRLNEPEVLYVVAIGCEHIVGPFAWTDADLVITDAATHTLVVDSKSGFELRCSGVALALGPATDLDVTFENFLGEPIEDSA